MRRACRLGGIILGLFGAAGAMETERLSYMQVRIVRHYTTDCLVQSQVAQCPVKGLIRPKTNRLWIQEVWFEVEDRQDVFSRSSVRKRWEKGHMARQARKEGDRAG